MTVSTFSQIDGFVQERRNAIGNAMEILQSFTKPSIYGPQSILATLATVNI